MTAFESRTALDVRAHDASGSLLEVRELTVEFRSGRRHPPFKAVDAVDLDVAPRETVGLVGESGSGKTTLGRAILGLVPIAAGAVSFDGWDIANLSYRERRGLSRDLQVVFQDPYSSLNPTRTIRQTLTETLRIQRLDADECAERVATILERVGLSRHAADRYPNSFSGGQRQRIAIARALIVDPRLVICDEPVSALDLSVQAQVLNLLRELQEQLQLSSLFISHDLAVVRHVAHRIVVLYRGRVMEQGDAREIYERPAHPYTRALLDAAPVPSPEQQRRRRTVRGARNTDAAARAPETACAYVPRCPYASDVCRARQPLLEPTPEGSLVACHNWREVRDRAPAQIAPRPESRLR